MIPEAGIVNFYPTGAVMGCHRDDVEETDDAPVVSISIGPSCVFLIGGHDRDDASTALLLRSGDVVVIGGESRLCYHGVPRVFTDEKVDGDVMTSPVVLDGVSGQELRRVRAVLGCTRINLNVRQVFPNAGDGTPSD